MTTAAWIALGVLAVAAIGNWVSRVRADRTLEWVTKPAATVALVALAIAIDPSDPAQRWWFVVALAWSLAGDVLLMLPRDRFVAGLGAFLLAHVCYVVGFAVAGFTAGALLVAGAITALVVAPVGARVVAALRAGGHRALVAPVVAYVVVIAVMVTAAGAHGVVVGIVGAALFALSDSLIAWNRFVRTLRHAPLAIMVTYHLGQLGLVLSLV